MQFLATKFIDAWGNLLGQAGWSPTYGARSEPIMSAVTADIHNRICTACYDPAGNMTSYGGVAYTYDDENRLIVANGVFYYYDGDGNRVAKCDVNTCLTTTGTTGTFYWRGVDGNTLVESNIAGTFQYEYIFFNGERVAQRSLTGLEPVYYYNSDHLGSTSVLTDSTGNIQDESDYYPYGGERVLSNAAPQNYKFTGKERDAESGLDMFGARYYGSSLGRFITPDWAAKPTAVPYAHYGNPQSLNLYSYVQNNPTTVGDPDGHCDLCWSVAERVVEYVAAHPDVANAVQKVGDSLGLKASVSLGNKINVGPVKVSLAVSVTAELREDGSGKSKLQATGGASVNGVGAQANGTATFAEPGSFVNPLKNLDGNAKLTGSAGSGQALAKSARTGHPEFRNGTEPSLRGWATLYNRVGVVNRHVDPREVLTFLFVEGLGAAIVLGVPGRFDPHSHRAQQRCVKRPGFSVLVL